MARARQAPHTGTLPATSTTATTATTTTTTVDESEILALRDALDAEPAVEFDMTLYHSLWHQGVREDGVSSRVDDYFDLDPVPKEKGLARAKQLPATQHATRLHDKVRAHLALHASTKQGEHLRALLRSPWHLSLARTWVIFRAADTKSQWPSTQVAAGLRDLADVETDLTQAVRRLHAAQNARLGGKGRQALNLKPAMVDAAIDSWVAEDSTRSLSRVPSRRKKIHGPAHAARRRGGRARGEKADDHDADDNGPDADDGQMSTQEDGVGPRTGEEAEDGVTEQPHVQVQHREEENNNDDDGNCNLDNSWSADEYAGESEELDYTGCSIERGRRDLATTPGMTPSGGSGLFDTFNDEIESHADENEEGDDEVWTQFGDFHVDMPFRLSEPDGARADAEDCLPPPSLQRPSTFDNTITHSPGPSTFPANFDQITITISPGTSTYLANFKMTTQGPPPKRPRLESPDEAPVPLEHLQSWIDLWLTLGTNAFPTTSRPVSDHPRVQAVSLNHHAALVVFCPDDQAKHVLHLLHVDKEGASVFLDDFEETGDKHNDDHVVVGEDLRQLLATHGYGREEHTISHYSLLGERHSSPIARIVSTAAVRAVSAPDARALLLAPNWPRYFRLHGHLSAGTVDPFQSPSPPHSSPRPPASRASSPYPARIYTAIIDELDLRRREMQSSGQLSKALRKIIQNRLKFLKPPVGDTEILDKQIEVLKQMVDEPECPERVTLQATLLARKEAKKLLQVQHQILDVGHKLVKQLAIDMANYTDEEDRAKEDIKEIQSDWVVMGQQYLHLAKTYTPGSAAQLDTGN